ncbi:unnamed protein product [Ranitomeya imitator]|uniref:Uncharacterized protein n=1 Tax=Ranitomeya imitator TaxID=111125 RepID=A0ABN9KUN3_9NEOB|nr:unnamed protein product [Ranitomeya imitator]
MSVQEAELKALTEACRVAAELVKQLVEALTLSVQVGIVKVLQKQHGAMTAHVQALQKRLNVVHKHVFSSIPDTNASADVYQLNPAMADAAIALAMAGDPDLAPPTDGGDLQPPSVP